MTVSAGDLGGWSTLGARGALRHATADDTIDGVVPGVVIEPDTPEALAEILKWWTAERLRVVVRGSGSKLGWGKPPDPIDVILSTKRLARVLAHEHGDLTATFGAGAPLHDVNLELGRHRQWLPFDSAFDGATIGGIVATNDSGSLRHRYGTPRDLLIGIRLATTDGLLVKSGGNVVKNVAGYDLGRLMCGSMGTFAAIVSATFKLAPVIASSSTVAAMFSAIAPLCSTAGAVSASQIEPAAFDVCMRAGRDESARYQLLLRFVSTTEAIARQVERAQSLMSGADRTDILSDHAEADLWNAVTREPWAGTGALLRLSWLQSSLPRVLSLVGGLAGSVKTVEFVGRAVVGAGLLRIDADAESQAAAIDRLRASSDVVGNVVVLRADTAVKERVGVFGPAGDSFKLLREIKRAFDPAGILNAGRGIV